MTLGYVITSALEYFMTPFTLLFHKAKIKTFLDLIKY